MHSFHYNPALYILITVVISCSHFTQLFEVANLLHLGRLRFHIR